MSMANVLEQDYRWHYVAAVVTLTIFVLLKKYGIYQIDVYSMVACITLVVLAWPLRYHSVSKTFSILLRSVTGILGLYALLGYIPLSEGYLAIGKGAEYVAVYGRWMAVFFAIVAICCRPAFAWIPVLYVPWQKELLGRAAGFSLSITDYWVLVEFGALLLLGATIAYWLGRIGFAGKSLEQVEQQSEKTDYWSYTQFVALMAISVHLANYLFSGVMKVIIGKTPWDWVLTNDTHNIMIAAELAHTLPLTVNDWLLSVSHEAMAHMFVLTNLAIFMGQLFAVIAIGRVSWIIGATLFYDLTHVVIFLVTGIFFWKWILLNFAIVAAMMAIRRKGMPKYWGFGFASFMSVSHVWFFVAWLGWFDTRSMILTRLVAITEDGKSYMVPSNYFLPYSIRMAQQRMGLANALDSFPGHFDIGNYGFTHSYRKRQVADDCGLSYDKSIPLSSSALVKNLEPFVLSHHNFIVTHADDEGRYPYDLYPHHIWTNPMEFRPFYELDKRSISLYRYEVSSVCFGYSDGKVVKHVVHQSSYDIKVR